MRCVHFGSISNRVISTSERPFWQKEMFQKLYFGLRVITLTWHLLCISRSSKLQNNLSQWSQDKKETFLFVEWFALCSLNFKAPANSLSHWSQGNEFFSWCALLWARRSDVTVKDCSQPLQGNVNDDPLWVFLWCLLRPNICLNVFPQ